MTVQDVFRTLRDHGVRCRGEGATVRTDTSSGAGADDGVKCGGGGDPTAGLFGADLCMHAGWGPVRINATTNSFVVILPRHDDPISSVGLSAVPVAAAAGSASASSSSSTSSAGTPSPLFRAGSPGGGLSSSQRSPLVFTTAGACPCLAVFKPLHFPSVAVSSDHARVQAATDRLYGGVLHLQTDKETTQVRAAFLLISSADLEPQSWLVPCARVQCAE